MDAVGNVLGRWNVGEGPAVMSGSHLDTVPRGGRFDGLLGAAAALEAIEAIKEAGIVPKRPLVVVATAEEEGRFGGMLGSDALSGGVDAAWYLQAADEAGTSLQDALRQAGLDPSLDAIRSAALDPKDVAAFLELHVEQVGAEALGACEGRRSSAAGSARVSTCVLGCRRAPCWRRRT